MENKKTWPLLRNFFAAGIGLALIYFPSGCLRSCQTNYNHDPDILRYAEYIVRNSEKIRNGNDTIYSESDTNWQNVKTRIFVEDNCSDNILDALTYEERSPSGESYKIVLEGINGENVKIFRNGKEDPDSVDMITLYQILEGLRENGRSLK